MEPAPTPNPLICPPPKPKVAPPEPLQQTKVIWRVYTHDNPPQGPAWALVTLTPEQYENLARNTAEILRWVEEAKSQLEYYTDE